MKIYDKCPKCDAVTVSVICRGNLRQFSCGSQSGVSGFLTAYETNTCLRRQLAQSQAREQKLKTALAVIELSFAAMQERAEAAERDRDGWKKCSNDWQRHAVDLQSHRISERKQREELEAAIRRSYRRLWTGCQ